MPPPNPPATPHSPIPLPVISPSVFISITRMRKESRLGLASGAGKVSRSWKPQTARGHLAACSAFPGRQADELFQQGSHPKSTTPALPKKPPTVSATEGLITIHGLSSAPAVLPFLRKTNFCSPLCPLFSQPFFFVICDTKHVAVFKDKPSHSTEV